MSCTIIAGPGLHSSQDSSDIGVDRMQRFDEDGSGEIELEEFRAMMAAVMPKAPDTTDHA